MHKFTPTDEDTELAFEKEDKLLILNYGDDVQWFNAQKDGRTGLVPGNYIDLVKANWYHGRIPRSKAESILRDADYDGAFLVRLSESSPNDFSLSVKCGDSVQHFRILKDAELKYFLWKATFNSLNELVEHYKSESVSRTQSIFLHELEGPPFTARAIYDFEPNTGDDAEPELGFRQGDLIQVFDYRDEHWWGGRIGDRTGFFPRLYVERVPI